MITWSTYIDENIYFLIHQGAVSMRIILKGISFLNLFEDGKK